jgi:hypothetical protein
VPTPAPRPSKRRHTAASRTVASPSPPLAPTQPAVAVESPAPPPAIEAVASPKLPHLDP